MRAVALALVLALLPASLPALAGDPVRARTHYDQGAAAYNLGRFDEAIAAFSDAYEEDHAPVLLFNIAQSHNKKGDGERALFFYRRYLEADPKASNRAQVEARIDALQAQMAKRAPAPTKERRVVPASALGLSPGLAPAPELAARSSLDLTATPDEAPPLYRRPWFWGTVGVVVIGAVAISLAAATNHKDLWSCGTKCGLGQVTVPGGM